MPTTRSWTDDDLRAAVASSKTYRAVLRLLGMQQGSKRYLQTQIKRLGLDTSHFQSYKPRLVASDDELRVLVESSSTRTEVLSKLNLELDSNNFRGLRERLRKLGIDTSHFNREPPNGTGSRTRWTNDQLRTAVAGSKSYAGVIRALGLVPAGGNYDQVRKRIADLGLDSSHFTGQGWCSGMTFPVRRESLDHLLVAGRATSSHSLKKRLIRAGLKPEACELCGWAERSPDGRIPIELDHINGDKTDNRLENLRTICPNCHALQPTHRGLNKLSVVGARGGSRTRMP